MSKRMGSVVVSVLFLALMPHVGSTQSIGIFLDPEASMCSAEVGANPLIELHVMALPGGLVPSFSVAQFSIWGIPESWTPDNVFWVNDTSVGLAFGNPLFTSAFEPSQPGLIVSFRPDYCRGDAQPPDDVGPIPIGRIIIAGAMTPPNTTIRVGYYVMGPLDPRCPFMIACDDPLGFKICVTGGEAVLNPTAAPGCQVVAVQERTWAGVKAMYR